MIKIFSTLCGINVKNIFLIVSTGIKVISYSKEGDEYWFQACLSSPYRALTSL